jgi:hypothetical protein
MRCKGFNLELPNVSGFQLACLRYQRNLQSQSRTPFIIQKQRVIDYRRKETLEVVIP